MLALDGMSSGREQAESPVAVEFGIKLGRVGVVRGGSGWIRDERKHFPFLG